MRGRPTSTTSTRARIRRAAAGDNEKANGEANDLIAHAPYRPRAQ
jgi:hypothetical protein